MGVASGIGSTLPFFIASSFACRTSFLVSNIWRAPPVSGCISLPDCRGVPKNGSTIYRNQLRSSRNARNNASSSPFFSRGIFGFVSVAFVSVAFFEPDFLVGEFPACKKIATSGWVYKQGSSRTFRRRFGFPSWLLFYLAFFCRGICAIVRAFAFRRHTSTFASPPQLG
jgi:hypothetical protein